MSDIATKVKALQKEGYFHSLERNRKDRLIQKIKDDKKNGEKKADLQSKLLADMRNGVRHIHIDFDGFICSIFFGGLDFVFFKEYFLLS